MRRWMQIVGTLYLLMGIGFIPPLAEARVPIAFPFADGQQGTMLFKAFIDYSFMFGLELLVVGGFLLWASKRAESHGWLVWLVIWLEAIRGIMDDIYMLSRGYPAANNYVFVGFMIFHTIVIITGLRAVRAGQAT